MNDLNIGKIRSTLGNHPWSHLIQVFDEVDSTNNLAKAMASQGAPAGTVLIADRQRSGRGRLGRTFLSPGGVGIYFSVILRPNCPPRELMHLTCAAAVAMCDAVQSACGFRPGIKWTNDLVVEPKKLGGILTELSVDSKNGLVDWAVVGIGINCRQREEDFDESIRPMACSAEMVTGTPIDRNRLAAEMVQALFRMDRILLRQQQSILEIYKADCITLGRHVSIVRGDEIRHGVAVDIDSAGELIVRYDDGTSGTVSSGEVSIRGLYGYI